MGEKHNSINDQAAQQIRNTENVLELLTRIEQALSSNESHVTATTYDANGNQVSSQIPTIGFLNQKLEQTYQFLKKISNIDGNPSTLQIGNISKRIISVDLNNEPKTISSVNTITTFKTDPNWIFDSFLNPKISIELDLTNKIAESCKTIQSKRYIVDFDKIVTTNPDNTEITTLTTDAKLRLAEFKIKYQSSSSIDIDEFTQWLDTPGLVNKYDTNYIDQDYFRIEPTRLKYKGNFSVLSTDIDTINKKMWYILDTLIYQDVSVLNAIPSQVELKIGDSVSINANSNNEQSATIYKVVEISTITSEYRVRFEQIFGNDPIPVKINSLSIYSNTIPTRNVRISVGFDEYCVIFVKAIDDISNIISTKYSPGTGFYTSELRLDNASGEFLSDYYITKVNDYGIALEDLVAKKIPNVYGEKPNSPELNPDNFKVVQVNEHLTQTVDAEKIRDLHNEKNTIASKIETVQIALTKETKLMQTKTFTSVTEKKSSQNNITTLSSKLDNLANSKVTIINQILSNKKNLNKISPIYHLRGVFPMPVSRKSTKTKPQEIVQFEIWYRKLSISGNENPILTIQNIDNKAAKQASKLNTNVLSNLSKPEKINATFSNWTKYRTDSRTRVQDPITGEWFWEIVDVTDANTPNINQVDLAILPGEKIEIKIKSLSEVGYPETPIESEFSNTISIPFPDDLKNVLSEDDFVLKEAQIDEMRVNFDKDLDAMGLKEHLKSSMINNNIYMPHQASDIGIKDTNGNITNLYDYINKLVSKLDSLEEIISRSKGILEVYLVNKGNKIRLYSGNNLTYNINLEDYMSQTKIGLTSNPTDSIARTYKNELILINDYSIIVKNAAESANLGLLSFRGYGSPAGFRESIFAYDGNMDAPFDVVDINLAPGIPLPTIPLTDRAIQAVWIDTSNKLLFKTNSLNGIGNEYKTTPKFATQINNQFVWLQVKDINGDYIYNGTKKPVIGQYNNNLYSKNTSNLVNNASGIHNIVISKNYNVGLFATVNNVVTSISSLPITDITDNTNWEILEDPTNVTPLAGSMGTTIHTQVDKLEDLTDISSQLVKIIKPGDSESISYPIQIFAKPYTGTGVRTATSSSNTTFYDDNYDGTLTGDMPLLGIDLYKQNGTNNLMISYTGTHTSDVLNVGDKVVLNDFSGVNTNAANNKVLTVVSCVSNFLILKYSVPNILTYAPGVTALNEGIPKIIQIHKKYSPQTELNVYNVLGRTSGNDDRYVNNYLEIVPGNLPDPKVHNKKLRMYLEEESNVRPFEFQLNFNITQYKSTLFAINLYNFNSII